MLRAEAHSGFLNFDWGFQSIAQSKFQRTASHEGKGFQGDIRVFLRQYFSRRFSKKVGGRNVWLLGLFDLPARIWRGVLIEGSGEHANRIFLIKTFLKDFSPIAASCCGAMVSASIFVRLPAENQRDPAYPIGASKLYQDCGYNRRSAALLPAHRRQKTWAARWGPSAPGDALGPRPPHRWRSLMCGSSLWPSLVADGD